MRFGQPTQWSFTKRVSGHALGILLWLASPAAAQPAYNPLTIDDPTPQAIATFGWAVAKAGDVNGDGAPDFLVGAPRQDVGSNSLQGQAFVFSGADGSLLLTLDNPTPKAFTRFGDAVADLGDVNADGTPDFLVAAYFQDVGSNPLQGEVFLFISSPLMVTVDIKPNSFPNSINPRNKGKVPVAILTTDTFDATTVDPLSVEFGPNGATEAHGRGHIEDADGDGDLDLVLHFDTQDTGIQCGDTSASLTGETFGG